MVHAGPIDFHCHLDDPCFDNDRWHIIDRCLEAGFNQLVTVADAHEERSLAMTTEILGYQDGLAAVAGAHPHQADGYSPLIERRLLAFLDRCPVLAIGEVGLDFHYDFATRKNQEAVFRRQVSLAKERSLPLVIHSRQAEGLVLKILDQEKFPLPVVFHCYTGDSETAGEIVRRGYFLSFSGIITFRKADALRGVVAATPLTHLFSETDSPYLAPEPDRGKTNTPLAVARVVERIAAIKNTVTQDIQDQIAANYRRFKER